MPNIDTVQSLISWKPPYQPSLIADGVLLSGTRMIIFGPAKSWKSILANHTAFCLVNGIDWLGFKTTKCVVFRYQFELPKAVDRARIAKYSRMAEGVIPHHLPHDLYLKTEVYLKIDSTYGYNSLEKDITEIRAKHPTGDIVLIIDPLYKVVSGRITEEYDIRKTTDNLDILKSKYGLTIILVHHSRLSLFDTDKKAMDLGAEDMFGTAELNWWCDIALKIRVLTPMPDGAGNKVSMAFEIPRHAEKPLPKVEAIWDRRTLRPRIIKRQTPYDYLEESGISIRNLEE